MNAPQNAAPQNAAPQNAAPQNAAPQNAAPQNAAPQNAAPAPLPPMDIRHLKLFMGILEAQAIGVYGCGMRLLQHLADYIGGGATPRSVSNMIQRLRRQADTARRNGTW